MNIEITRAHSENIGLDVERLGAAHHRHGQELEIRLASAAPDGKRVARDAFRLHGVCGKEGGGSEDVPRGEERARIDVAAGPRSANSSVAASRIAAATSSRPVGIFRRPVAEGVVI